MARKERAYMNTLSCPELSMSIEYSQGHSIRQHLHEVFTELVLGLYQADVKQKDVVDIGAFFGETAIYFSKNGASRVLAYEPFSSGLLIDKNAKANNCDNVEWICAAVGGTDETIPVDAKTVNNGATRLSYGRKTGAELEQVSLETITNRHAIRSDAILKLDCEGSEFEILLQAPCDILVRYQTIMLEVHEYLGDSKALLNKLKSCGFKQTRQNKSIAQTGESLGREFWELNR
jgi:FkbM family methyltransferase